MKVDLTDLPFDFPSPQAFLSLEFGGFRVSGLYGLEI